MMYCTYIENEADIGNIQQMQNMFQDTFHHFHTMFQADIIVTEAEIIENWVDVVRMHAGTQSSMNVISEI